MICKKCGREMNDKDLFCPSCGTKQVTIYRQVFVRSGMSESQFIDSINIWFEKNPRVANVNCRFDMRTSVGMFANKYKLKEVVIEFELLDGINTYQYGITKESSTALIAKKANGLVDKWSQNHPGAIVVTWSGGRHSRGSSSSLLLGGIGACNRMNAYILYKFPRR